MTKQEMKMRQLVRESDVIDRTDGSELARAFNYLWDKYVENVRFEESNIKEQNYMRGYEDGKSDVLDKVIVEVVERRHLHQLYEVPTKYSSANVVQELTWVLEIIDKYKAESEEQGMSKTTCQWQSQCPYYEQTTSYGIEILKCENTNCPLFEIEKKRTESEEQA